MSATWRKHAACQGIDPEVFYPISDEEAGEAKAICAVCPVREPASSTPWPIGSARASGAAPPSGNAAGSTGSVASRPDPPLAGRDGTADRRQSQTTGCRGFGPRSPLTSRPMTASGRPESKPSPLSTVCRGHSTWIDPTHVTASAIVVGPRGVLLHRHRKLGRWMQPGGHLDPGEEPAEAAVRECREETGLTVTHPWGEPRLVHLDVHAAAAGHVHIDLRYLVGRPDAPPDPEPGESPGGGLGVLGRGQGAG